MFIYLFVYISTHLHCQTSGRLDDDDLDANEDDTQDDSEGETGEEFSETETPEGAMEIQNENGTFRQSLRRGSERCSSRKKPSKKKSKKSKKDKKVHALRFFDATEWITLVIHKWSNWILFISNSLVGKRKCSRSTFH